MRSKKLTKKERIKQRKSYAHWKKWFEFLKRNPNSEDIMRKVHRTIDAHKGYHSQRNSDYSKESLNLLLKEQLEINQSFMDMEKMGKKSNREMKQEIPRIKKMLRKLENNKELSRSEKNLVRKLRKRWVDLK